MKQNITFDDLPQAVTVLTHEVHELKRLLIERQEQPTTETPERLLTIDDAAKFLHLSKATLYSKISRGTLPVMKRGKRLYFSSAELMEYIKQGRKKTNAEIEAEAAKYVTKERR